MGNTRAQARGAEEGEGAKCLRCEEVWRETPPEQSTRQRAVGRFASESWREREGRGKRASLNDVGESGRAVLVVDGHGEVARARRRFGGLPADEVNLAHVHGGGRACVGPRHRAHPGRDRRAEQEQLAVGRRRGRVTRRHYRGPVRRG